MFQVITSQFLVFIAFCFSIAAFGDCSFVSVDQPIVVRQDGLTADRLGIITYQLENGGCYFYDQDIIVNVTDSIFPRRYSGEDQLSFYVTEVLGPNWYSIIALAAASTIVCVLVFLYISSYCCSTQVRGVRMFTGLFLSIIVVTLQGLTFLIFSSKWCENEGCAVGRSAAFSIAAASCLFASGIFFCTMNNYPGAKALAQAKAEYEAPIVPMAAAASPSADDVDDEPREPEPDEEEPFPEDDAYATMETQEGEIGSDDGAGGDDNNNDDDDFDGDTIVEAEVEVVKEEEPDLEAGEGEKVVEEQDEVNAEEGEIQVQPDAEDIHIFEDEPTPAEEVGHGEEVGSVVDEQDDMRPPDKASTVIEQSPTQNSGD